MDAQRQKAEDQRASDKAELEQLRAEEHVSVQVGRAERKVDLRAHWAREGRSRSPVRRKASPARDPLRDFYNSRKRR